MNGLVSGVFSGANDYTWERAIYDYLYGDRARAWLALGHNLHLIQDKTVPDHTRNDAHPNFLGNVLNQDSPFESYVKSLGGDIDLADTLIGQGKKPIVLNSLDDYFNNLSIYSNNNFFSKDTILDKDYKGPIIEFVKKQKLKDGIIYRFGFNQGRELVLIEGFFDKSRGLFLDNYSINDPDKISLSNYWSRLS